MELILYTTEKSEDLISKICEDWCKVYSIDLQLRVSKFAWSSFGDLPILQFNFYLIPKHEILNFLRRVLCIDWDISEESLNYFATLSEFCSTRLYTATKYAIHFYNDPQNYFLLKSSNFFKRFADFFIYRYKRTIENPRISKKYGIYDEINAFQVAEESHRVLSQFLDESYFFSSKFSASQRPHSIDFIIFAFLHQELNNLENHIHVTNSLNDYPNLINFYRNMENIIQNSKRNEVKIINDHQWIEKICIRKNKNFTNDDSEEKKHRLTIFSKFAVFCIGFIIFNQKTLI